MDALELLRSQHELVMRELEAVARQGASLARSQRIAHLLLGHMVIEEHLFYPRLGLADSGDGAVQRCFEEHMITRFALGRAMVGAEEARARFGALRDVCQHHMMEEEERRLFPRARRILSAAELRELGSEMQIEFERVLHAELSDVLEPDGSLRLRENPAPSLDVRPARARRAITR